MKRSRSRIRSTEILFHVLSGITILMAMSEPVNSMTYAALSAGFFFAASITESRRMYGHYAERGTRAKRRTARVPSPRKRKK